MSNEQDWLERPLSRRRLLYLGGGLGLSLWLAGCGGSGNGEDADATDTSEREAGGGVLRVGVPGDIGGWDFDYLGFNLVGIMVLKNIYPFAIDYGVTTVDGAEVHDTESFVNQFAESWQAGADGKTWTLTLREGATFKSGNPVTAEDVKWSKDRAFAAQANVAGIYRLIGLTKPEQVEVVDERTVRFHQEFPSALSTQIQIISLFLFDSVEAKKHATASDPWAKDWANKNPQDGGAFNVASYTAGQSLELVANPDFPGDEPPSVGRVQMSIIPSTSNMRLQLEKGDIDMAIGLRRTDVEELRGKEGIEIVSAPSNEYTTIQIDVTKAPFDDARVRQAMAYAVPYQQIIDSVFNGDARRSTSVVPLDMPGHTEAGYPYDTDPEKAKQLLQEAGRTSIESELVIEAGNAEQRQLAIQVTEALKEVGIDLRITELDPATLSDRRGKKTIPLQITSGQQWVNDVEYLLATSLTKGAFLNYSNYVNPTVEDVFQKLHTTTDAAEREALAEQAQEQLAKDVPWIMLGQPNFNLPVREEVSGWVQPVDGLARFRYLEKA